MSAPELQERIQAELWGSSVADFRYTIVALVASVPASRYVPAKQRFLPLLVLGAVGSLADYFEGQRRAEPFKRALDALQSTRQ